MPIVAALILLGAMVPQAPQSPAFDVVSVKPNRSSAAPYSNFPLGPGDAYVANPGYFVATNQPLIAYLRFAFKLSQTDLPGLPRWVYDDRFDIEARAQGNPTKDEMRRMMQSLLADRFKLTTHTETQTKPAFHLVPMTAGRAGPQLQVHSEQNGSCSTSARLQLPNFPCGSIGPIPASTPDRGRIGGKDVTMARIAGFLTNPFTGVDRPVLDDTGLTGTFDFSLEWALPRDSALPAARPEDAEPTLLQALEEQLGLTLKSTRAPVAMVVVDHIEQPSAN